MNGLSYDSIAKEFARKNISYDIVYMESIDSTNTYAMKNEPINTVVVANSQTAGKGRLGRSFESEAGKGIFMTIVVKPDKKTYEVANITLIAAVAVARACKKRGLHIGIKWPNDIICNGRKLCGILTEMKNDGANVRMVAVGIGMNINNEAFSDEIENKAISVYNVTGARTDVNEWLAEIVAEFDRVYKEYLNNKDLTFIMDEYNDLLVNRGSTVIVEHKGEKATAIQLGIDEAGMLKVVKDNKEMSISFGEILIRGVEGYV